MTVTYYGGLPGAGKSYSIIENVVIPALKERRHVCHNLVLNSPALRYAADPEDGKPFDPEKYLHRIPNFDEMRSLEGFPEAADDADQTRWAADYVVNACRPGAVVVLDEVWQYWPAGLKVSDVPSHQVQFWKKHRHRVDEETGHATDIYIVDQDAATGVPSFIRSLIDLTLLHEKQDKVGAKGVFRVMAFHRCQRADKPAASAKIRTMMGRYKPEVWNCYQSHTENKKGNLGTPGLEVQPDKRGNIWSSWQLKASGVALVALPFMFWWAYSAYQGLAQIGGKPPTPPQVSGRERAVPVATPTAPEPVRKRVTFTPTGGQPVVVSDAAVQPGKMPPAVDDLAGIDPELAIDVSPTWRLLGVVESASQSRAILSNAGGRRVMSVKRCERFQADWRCRVEDGWAYFWSGTQRGLSAALPEGAGKDGTPTIVKPPA